MIMIATAITGQDFETYFDSVVSIKGNVGWVSAYRLHRVTIMIENAFRDKETNFMLTCYPFLVEKVIEYKRFSQVVQQELLKGKPVHPDQTPGTMNLSNSRTTCVSLSYHLKYCNNDDYYYCLQDNQNSKYQVRNNAVSVV